MWGRAFAIIFSGSLPFPVSKEAGIVSSAIFVGSVVAAGTRVVAGTNRLFMLGLALCYCTLVLLGLPHVNVKQLLSMDWNASLATIPIFLVCFGYQNLVPSLTYYVKKDATALRFAILVGNLIPFLIYFLWNFVILGIAPEAGLEGHQNDRVAGLLEEISQSQAIHFSIKAFSFFAIFTSFIANMMTFVDFFERWVQNLFQNRTARY